MSSLIQACEIRPKTGELLLDNVTIVLRPKTFELLLLLADRPNHVFSKEEILESVWKDAVVEEQVIFQSINEIRKETGHADIVKTYPKRGYSWQVADTYINKVPTQDKLKTPDITASKVKPNYLPYLLIGLAILALLLVYLGTTSIRTQETNASLPVAAEATSTAHKGILVLPFNVSTLAGSQQWLRFGAMEGLINKLSPNQTVTVFHVEDAIEILNRLPISERNDVNKIFGKSGASHIIQTSISGQPGELNIVYTIYTRTSRITKALNATSIDTALPKLASTFVQVLGEKIAISKASFNTQLQNELIAKAMQFLEADDNESALAFIESAVINDTDNIVALYFLAKINMELGKVDKSLEAANQALALADNKALNEYKHRLYFLKGSALLSLGKLNEGETSLLSAEQVSKASKDWLYYAYTQSMLGKISQHQARFEDAYKRLNSALEYQELLKCPLGIAQGHLDLAEFHISNKNKQQAQKSFEIAKKLIDEKQLLQAVPLLSHVEHLILPNN